MLKNTECASIIQVVGAGSGRTFDIDATRYQKIIFMADADSDGAHIRCLLATLFFKYMPELIEKGRVYTRGPAAAPHRDLQPEEGHGEVRLHLLRRRAAAEARGAEEEEPQSWKDPVQRYKGLGEMDADQLAETTMDPRRRTLRRLTFDDAEDASQVFELLMGSDVAPRKEFIVQGAYEVDVEALDA